MGKTAVYRTIADHIKKEIVAGNLKADQRLYSEAELTKLFDVSRATAAKALDLLTTENVIYRIQGKGSFVKSAAASRGRTMTVSLILPFDMSDSNRIDEFNVIRGVESYLSAIGYNLLINYGSDDPDVEMNLINRSRSKNVDGIIVYPTTLYKNITFLNELVLEAFPIVFIDRTNSTIPIPCVSSDNVNGGYLSASHLINKKYDNIFFISDVYVSVISSIKDRYFGYCKALKSSGIELSHSNLIEGFAMKGDKYTPISYESNPDFYKEILTDIKKRSIGRIGIVCANDLIAYSFILAAIDLGLVLTKDVGIVGFNDADIASHSVYPITTIRQNFYNIGRTAAKIVINRINGEKSIENTPIPVELIERNSC